MMNFIERMRVSGRRGVGGIRDGSRRRQTRWTGTVEPLESRDLLSTVQNFNAPSTGTPYARQQFGNPPGPQPVAVSATNSVMRLTSGTAATLTQNNQIAFNMSDPGTYNQAEATFDFQIIPGTGTLGGRGNGISFALLNTDNYGTTGAATASVLPPKGLFNSSLGVGFNTTQASGDVSDNFVVISFNAAPVGEFDISKSTLDLASGDFITADVVVDFVQSTVSVSLTPTAGGTTVQVVSAFPVAGLTPYQSRVAFTGTAVSSLATENLDNVNVVYSGLRLAGTISFGSTNFAVPENIPSGLAPIVITRNGGTAGSAVVLVVPADKTAKNNVNYIPEIIQISSSGVPTVNPLVVFAEGESTKTIYIPVLDDHLADGDKTVSLFLSNTAFFFGVTSAPATLTAPIASTLTIVNTNAPPPTVSPVVTKIYVPRTRRVSAFQLTFSQPMDPDSAENLANYVVGIPPARRRGRGRPLPISRAVVDASGLTVTLYRANTAGHLPRTLQILVRGEPPTGLRSVNGTFLAGTGGVSGTNALLRVFI